ncbi:MAG: aquaporin [Acholeplasma sp.]|jgi:aquaporin Z|nr:MAG: aquaporin [Acholeplasma sp.]
MDNIQGDKNHMMKKLIAEFYGTFILLFVGVGSIVYGLASNLLGVAVAFGMGVAIAIFSLGHISGAHFNPAVSLGMLIAKRLSVKEFFGYVVAQIFGGILAVLVFLITKPIDAFVTLGENGFALPTTVWIVLLFETILTFILVFTILTTSKKANLESFMALIVGVTLIGLILVGGPVSGASLNPVRSLAPALFAGSDALAQVWVYLVAPLLGGALAGMIHRFKEV